LAKRIIEMAQRGQTNPQRLSEDALQFLAINYRARRQIVFADEQTHGTQIDHRTNLPQRRGFLRVRDPNCGVR
jgi:hypothetical protein